MITPTLEQARTILENSHYDIIPISMEMQSDMYTPMGIMRTLKSKSRHCFVLESAENNRYTFLGFDPKTKVSTKEQIEQILGENKAPKIAGLPPFCGGLVGYFAYEYAKDFRDVDLMLFDKVIAFDNHRQKIVLIVNIKTDNLENEYSHAKIELKQLKDLIKNGTTVQIEPARLKSDFTPLFTKEQYCSMVEKAKHYIKEGDIFQVVLSNRWQADFEGSLFDCYRVLRGINPSPYMFYFCGTDYEIAGASPETLVKLIGKEGGSPAPAQDGQRNGSPSGVESVGKLYTFPLAGTRPRGKTLAEDMALEKELLADEKELSEHNMLVDLGRNDLGKISKFGSVKVDKYMNVLRFSHVMHIGSVVSGDILPDKTGLDAIEAVLPAGTLSGAPKIRAMEIIGELEDCKQSGERGIYGGAIGYLDFTGNMDTCIAIRLAYKKDGKVFVRSGAGVVADSVPEAEYEECLNKSMAVKKALLQSQGGLD